MPSFAAEPPIPKDVRSVLLAGGTFDPPHRAHIELAFAAASQADCDHILFVPAGRSPFKSENPTGGEHRLAMLRLALADRHRRDVSVSRDELDRPPPSYTIDTLRRLRRDALRPDAEVCLLIGSDHALRFDRWRDWRDILRLATPVVALRPPHTKQSLRDAGLDERWLNWIIETPLDPVKSTNVRERLERGDDVSGLLDPRVVAYIKEHGLYTRA